MESTKFFKSLMVGAMALSMAACGGSGDAGDAEGDDKEGGSASSDGEVSVFYYTYNDAYISSVRSALDADLKEAGVNYVDYDSNNSQTTQTEQVDTAIAKGSKCLVVNLVDSNSEEATKALVEKAESAGIPIIFFNRSVPEAAVSAYDKAAFVGTDYEQAGKMQGDLIGNYLVANYDNVDLNEDGVISYVMFKGDEANLEAIARTQYGVENADAVLADNGKEALAFYDSANSNGYLVDQNGAWSSQAANEYMQTILSQYNTDNNNMVELVIANNDEMALGAISALQNAGMNTTDSEIVIPVFGVDATDAAKEKIDEGTMTGTIKQDAEGMAKVICKMVTNLVDGKDKFDGVEADQIVGTWRVNIPYSEYTK